METGSESWTQNGWPIRTLHALYGRTVYMATRKWMAYKGHSMLYMGERSIWPHTNGWPIRTLQKKKKALYGLLVLYMGEKEKKDAHRQSLYGTSLHGKKTVCLTTRKNKNKHNVCAT